MLYNEPVSYLSFDTFNSTDWKTGLANSVDPDEMAHNEPSHQDLHCLSFCFIFLAGFPICNNGFVQIKDGRIYFRNSG